jgi:hypothetical protein
VSRFTQRILFAFPAGTKASSPSNARCRGWGVAFMNPSDSLWLLWLLTSVVWAALVLAVLYLGSLFLVVLN